MSFYEKYISLCAKQRKSSSEIAREIGVTPAAVSGWKKGAKPKDTAVAAVAMYFNVPVSYFSEDEKKPTPITESELKLNEPERAFILWLRSLPEDKRQAVLNFADTF